MSKRLILSIIIATLCFMNIFIPVLPGHDYSYFDWFMEAYNDEYLDFSWKTVAMAPTGILIILTTLHILEPRSLAVKRKHLALASVFGFIIYITFFLIVFGMLSVANELGFLITDFIMRGKAESQSVNIGDVGWEALLYPALFLSYVLVHRFMKYKTPEQGIAVEPSIDKEPKSGGFSYNEDELL